MSTKDTCNICCDTYNKSNREKVCCSYCDFPSCRTCCETYILSESIPKCMNPTCAKEWSRKFIRENFTNVFINTKFRGHLETILFDQEKALLPATQPIVEEKIRKEKVRKEMGELDKLIHDLQKQRRALETGLYTQALSSTEKKERAEFVRQCPANGCRGFLSSQWKCGICEQWSCPQCHELKGLNKDCEHTCDPNSVETAKLLAKDSKPCPKCQCLIFKISGCDQMWCTQCHTAFSWKTGAIEKNIHNPHYYEWQRKNGGLARAAGDIECGRELDHRTSDNVQQLIREKHKGLIDVEKTKNRPTYRGGQYDNTQYLPIVSRLSNIIRDTIHNTRVELPRFQTDYVQRNQDLRVQYLCNEIDEETFKTLVQRNDKKNRKNTEIAQVLQLANTAVTDIVFRIIYDLRNSDSNKHNLEVMISEFDAVINYCNEILKDVGFVYNCVQYRFSDTFIMSRSEKEKKLRKKKDDDEDENDDIVDNNTKMPSVSIYNKILDKASNLYK